MKIIAHRGVSAIFPENTMLAFERALEVGVDAIEADLLATKDCQIVVRHNDLIQKGGVWHYVRELTLDELREIDVGQGERIPLLEQLLEQFLGRCPLVLDIKDFGIAELLAPFLKKRQQVRENIHISSFLHSEVAAIGQLCPEVDRSITLAAIPVDFESLFRKAGTQAALLHRAYLNRPVIQKLRERGASVGAYPVNLIREASTFASLGINAIYTDDPAAMQKLRERSK